MKNTYTFLAVLYCLSVLSYGKSKNSPAAISPPRLVKMIVFPGTVSEKQYNFNADGLIANIQNHNDIVIASFTYDVNQNLLTADFAAGFFSPTAAQSNTFVYDSSNIIVMRNGYPVYYFSETNSYKNTLDPDPNYGTTWKLHSNGLLADEWAAYMDEGNLVIVDGVGAGIDDSGDLTGSSHDGDYPHFWRHLLVENPAQAGFYPLCKAMAITNFNHNGFKFVDAMFYSSHLYSEDFYDLLDPESYKYMYEMNAFNQPINQYRTNFYLGEEGNTFLYALYYYEGDIIPD